MRFSPYVIPVILGLGMTASPVPAWAQIGVEITASIAPPPLPVYAQPPIPEPGYLWTPGYWAYADAGDYYWVPGTWVRPPSVGLLWTPAWWGFNNGFYGFHTGYWGPHVGFYGGINYGFGYSGAGFFGGRWDHGAFAYNGAVNNFGGTHITNVYRENVVNNTTVNRTSFNGGSGGIQARATSEQEAAEHEQHVSATPEQTQHMQAASSNPALRAAANHGQPAIAATARPGEFSGRGIVAARAAARSPAAPGAHGAAAGNRAAPAAAARQTPHPAAAKAPKAAQQPHPAARPQQHAAPAREAGKEEHR